jgi:predicted SAM-dependent methyltransferase
VSASTNTAQRIGSRLRRRPIVHKAATLAIQAFGRARRARQINAYLAANQRRYLRIGSGSHTDRGWLSVDLLPVRLDVVFMDATKPFPIPSGSFDAIQCEHVIEHLDYASGVGMLRECHRILRKRGILRIATPNLDLVRRLLGPPDHDHAITAYVHWSNERFGGSANEEHIDNAAFTANRLVREWGHTFIHDERTLRGALAAAGFSEIVRVSPGESAHPELSGVDRHEEEVGREANELETLAFEATA